MQQSLFVERECHFGGCACGVWSDWWEALREFAKKHPRGRELDAIEDGDTYSEAVDELAAELEHEFEFMAPACQHRGCARAA